eukprot:7386327-Prymnesium_polylepis.3
MCIRDRYSAKPWEDEPHGSAASPTPTFHRALPQPECPHDPRLLLRRRLPDSPRRPVRDGPIRGRQGGRAPSWASRPVAPVDAA